MLCFVVLGDIYAHESLIPPSMGHNTQQGNQKKKVLFSIYIFLLLLFFLHILFLDFRECYLVLARNLKAGPSDKHTDRRTNILTHSRTHLGV